jgi:hypothetical protein
MRASQSLTCDMTSTLLPVEAGTERGGAEYSGSKTSVVRAGLKQGSGMK